MKKKLISMLCVAAMAVSVLSGCGSDETVKESESTPVSESKEESKEVVESSEEESELEYVELDWYIYRQNASGSNDIDMIQEALDEYFMEKLNCKVNLQRYESADYTSNVTTALLAGENVGLVTVYGMNYFDMSQQGAFYPISDLWDEYAPGTKALYQDAVWDALTVNGNVYAVPTYKDNCYIMGYRYNDTLAQAIGVDPANYGWRSFLDMEEDMMEAKKLRDEKFPEYKDMPMTALINGVVPYYFHLERIISSPFIACCNLPGFEMVEGYGTDKVFCLYETDEYREMCHMIKRLVDAGVMAYDYNSYERDVKYEPSTLIMPAWGSTYTAANVFSEDFDCKLTHFDNTWSDTSNYTSAMTAISANCNDPERAAMVMELMNTDSELSTILHFGVEGTHWFKQADGTITFEGGRNADESAPGWLEWFGTWAGNMTIVEGPESKVGPDGVTLTKIAEANDKAKAGVHMGFVLDTEPIANELAAVKSVTSEYGALHFGQIEDVDAALDAMIEKLHANGIDKILEEVQRQMDEWKASK